MALNADQRNVIHLLQTLYSVRLRFVDHFILCVIGHLVLQRELSDDSMSEGYACLDVLKSWWLCLQQKPSPLKPGSMHCLVVSVPPALAKEKGDEKALKTGGALT